MSGGDGAQMRYTLDGSAASVTVARADARAFFDAASPPLEPDMQRDALLAVSELVTNAVLHAPGPCALELRDDGQRLTIAVSDTGELPPAPRPMDLDGGGGLGLHVLSVMTGGVRIKRFDGGKTVAVDLERRHALAAGG
jgi:anti-sigma regulatory factor (Ser/Thr protein kinase)